MAPARADVPSFAAYFAGTWTCTSKEGSNIVKAYGASPVANSFDMINAYVYKSGYLGLIGEHYTQHDAVATVVQEFAPGANYVGTSSAVDANPLVFTGTFTRASGSLYERMTITKTDATHFTRVFESGKTSAGPLTEASSEACVKVASDPVPSPRPTQ